MALTLNQVIKRLETLALSHRQINHFFIGDIDEFLDDADVVYPALFCEIKPSRNSRTERLTTFNFRFYFLDLVGVSSESLRNEWEVKSDMTSVALDYLAMLMYTGYQDEWDIATEASMEFRDYQLHDLASGVSIDVGVSVRFAADRCQVPADNVEFENSNNDMLVQNYVYVGTGAENDTLTVGTLANKKILLLLKGDKTLVPTTGTPTPNEYSYTASTGTFLFGNDIEQDQVIQILWRNL